MKGTHSFNADFRRLLALGLSAAMLSAASLPAAAEPAKTPSSETHTYYFLAPHKWFKTEAGAANESIGTWFWGSDSSIDYNNGVGWPGQAAEPAPEVGENVFKFTVEGSPENMLWNDYDSNALVKTEDLQLGGYNEASGVECPYDSEFTCDSFDGMIYVLGSNPSSGAWFTLGDYTEYDDYYGKYQTLYVGPQTYYFLAPDEWFKTEAGAANESIGTWFWDEATQKNYNGGANWPGREAEPAPEVGENVFKFTVEGLPDRMIWNDFGYGQQTNDLQLEGYNESSGSDCPYNSSFTCDSFDGMIFVLDSTLVSGAWFTLDDYKNHDDYYGTYSLGGVATADTPDAPYHEETPDDPYNPYTPYDYYNGTTGKIRFQADGIHFRNTDTIAFYIWNESWGDFGTIHGWYWQNTWDDETLIEGTYLGNGVFESYEFGVPDDCSVYVIVHDITNNNQTCDIILTQDCFGDTLSLTGNVTQNPVSPALSDYEATFTKDTSGGPGLRITDGYTLVGVIKDPRKDYSDDLVQKIYDDLDDGSADAFTQKNVAAVMSGLSLDPAQVWGDYVSYSGRIDPTAYEIIYGKEFDPKTYFAEYMDLDLYTEVTYWEDVVNEPEDPNETPDISEVRVKSRFDMALTDYTEIGAPIYTADIDFSKPRENYNLSVYEDNGENNYCLASTGYDTHFFTAKATLCFDPTTNRTWIDYESAEIYPDGSYTPTLRINLFDDDSWGEYEPMFTSVMTLDPDSEQGRPVYTAEITLSEPYGDYEIKSSSIYGNGNHYLYFSTDQLPEVYAFTYDAYNDYLSYTFKGYIYDEKYEKLNPVIYMSHDEDYYDDDGNYDYTQTVTESFDMALRKAEDGRPSYHYELSLEPNSHRINIYAECSGEEYYIGNIYTNNYTGVYDLSFDPIYLSVDCQTVSIVYPEKMYSLTPVLRYYANNSDETHSVILPLVDNSEDEYNSPLYQLDIALTDSDTEYTFILSVASESILWTDSRKTGENGSIFRITYDACNVDWNIDDIGQPTATVGDGDGDGTIDSGDALLALRASVGLAELTPEQLLALDVDGDTIVTSIDAVSILRYSAGKSYIGRIGTAA